MGLDMYLYRMPIYHNITPRQIETIESNLKWQDDIAAGKCKKNMSMEEWCGVSMSELPDEKAFCFYVPHYQERYWHWDVEKKYPHKGIMEQVAYWRKANHIHHWFVVHVQDGEDDCVYHDEVTEETLRKLLADCKSVLQKVKYLSDGEVVVPTSARNILPTSEGFFFGSYEYDCYYVEAIKDTIKMVRKILEETDFETQMIYYVSSW